MLTPYLLSGNQAPRHFLCFPRQGCCREDREEALTEELGKEKETRLMHSSA